MRLTDFSIKALKTPERGAVIYPDDALTGFGVRVSQAGTKSFVLTHGVRRQRETIGRVGIISLADARAEAKRRLAEYTLGKQKTPAVLWAWALEQYLDHVRHTRKESTYLEYKRALERHFRFGETKLDDLSPRDLLEKLDKLKTTPSEQQHAYIYVRAFLNWAHHRNYLSKNPMERMKPPHRYIPRERVLTESELRRVWITACQMGTFGVIVKLLILTGQRVGEITQLSQEMIGEGHITLPASLTKNRREHTFPIGELAASIVGPHRWGGFSKSKAQLDKAADVHNWTLHDLRRTFASGLAGLSVPLPVIEKLLNHISGTFGGIVGVYQRYDYAQQMREAIEKWEKYIHNLTAHGRQPTGHRDVSDKGGRDAALIEEAGPRNSSVLASSHRPLGDGRQVPKTGARRPRTGRVVRARDSEMARGKSGRTR